MELEVRHLQSIDLFRLAKIIQKTTSASRESLIAAFRQLTESAPARGDELVDSDEQPYAMTPAAKMDRSDIVQELGFALFEAAIDQEQAIKELFAGLVNMKVAEFDKTPIDTTLVILEKVAEQNDLPAFLSRASQLASKLMGSST